MDTKILQNLKEALKGKKLIRLAHTLDEGLDQTVLNLPQEIWYKYPTLGEDFIKFQLEERGVPCVRPFPATHRDRQYYYDHLIWKMIADGYLKKMEEEPLFFCYKNSTHLDEACAEYGFKNLMPDYKLYKELQYKTQLQKYGVQEGKGLLPFFESSLKDVSYASIQEQFGDMFVVQFSFNQAGWNTMGSRDTHIIENEIQFQKLRDADLNTPAKISKFIHGEGVCMNVVNTNKGPVTSELYMQITGEPNLTDSNIILSGARFGGNEAYISEEIQLRAEEIARNIGTELYKKNYKGHFGIDFILEKDTGNLYVLEINPRFTGSAFIHTFLADQAEKTPLIALHFAEYLDCLPESFDIPAYENSMKGVWRGSSLYIRNREGQSVQTTESPKPGIYKIHSEGIEYIEEAFSFKKLPKKDHFLIKQVSPLKRNIHPNDPLCTIFSFEEMFEGTKLSNRYKNVVQIVYEKFKKTPAGVYDSSVPYKVF